MAAKYWRGQRLDLDDVPEPTDPAGPDERDADLFDEPWAPALGRRDRRRPSLLRYGTIALSVLAVASILVPMVLAVTR